MYSVSDDSPTLLWFSVCYQCSRKKFQTRRLPPRRVMKGFRELGPVQGARTSCLPRPLALSDGVSVFFVLSKSCSGWHEEAFDMFKCKVWWGSPTTFKVTWTRKIYFCLSFYSWVYVRKTITETFRKNGELWNYFPKRPMNSSVCDVEPVDTSGLR